MQWQSGAYSTDVGSNADEPAHVVTTLLVHDYVAHFLHPVDKLPTTPRAYAESYYAHYPKVGIGHWPPLLYVLQALWIFAFGRTKVALLVFMLGAMSSAVILLYYQVRPIAGAITALLFLLLFLSSKFVARALYSDGPDAVLILVFCICAVFGCAALQGNRKSWIGFWGFAIVAVMVHARGASLMPVPVIATLLTGRKSLMKQWENWLVPALALFVGIPWLIFSRQTFDFNFAAVAQAAAAFPGRFYVFLGPILTILTLVGSISAILQREPRWLLFPAIILAAWIFYSFALVLWEWRYLLPILPACIVMSVFGLRCLVNLTLAGMGQAVSGAKSKYAVAVSAAIVACVSVANALPLEKKPDQGYGKLVEQMETGPAWRQPVYLVAGNAEHEGSFIAAVDLAEATPRHMVLRASKALAKTDWSLLSYSPLFHSPADMAAFLESSWVSTVVIQSSSVRPDVLMLQRVMNDFHWEKVDGPNGSSVFRKSRPAANGKITIRIDMRDALGKYIDTTLE